MLVYQGWRKFAIQERTLAFLDELFENHMEIVKL
jgi:hypothetical protein